MKIIDGAVDALKRFRMEFLNSNRSCIFTHALETIRAGGRILGPFQANGRAELPNWVIDVLLKHDVVELAPEDAYESLRRVTNLFNTERKQPRELHSKIPSRFLYRALSEKIRRLQSDKTALDPRIYDEIEHIRRVTQYLIDTRLSKLIRVARAGITQDKMKRMTVEERWLCEELGILLSEWKQAVLNENKNVDTGA